MRVRLRLLTLLLLVASSIIVPTSQANDVVALSDDLIAITPGTITNLALLSHLPEMERPVSLAFAANMSAVFVQTETQTGGGRAAMLTWPSLQPILTELPLETGYLGGDGLLFTPDSRVVVALDRNGKIIFYQTATGQQFEMSGFGLTAYTLRMDGLLAAGYTTFDVATGSVHTLCLIDPFNSSYASDDRLCLSQSASVRVVHFLPSSTNLLVQTERNLSLIDATTGEILQTYDISLPTSGTMATVPNPEQDLPTVFISQQDYVLSLNLNDGFQRTYANGQGAVVTRIIVHPNGGQVLFLVRSDAQSIEQVWAVDVATKSVLARLPLYNREEVGYNADGSLAFVNNTIYQTDNWDPVFEMGIGERPITFSPDRRLLVTLNTGTWRFNVYGIPSPQ